MSIPFNKKMAHALYLSGDIEAWGQSTLEIISSSLRHSGIPPMFSDKLYGIMVSIYKTDDDFYSELELDARMIKIIKHIQKSGMVSNKDVQAIASGPKPPPRNFFRPCLKWCWSDVESGPEPTTASSRG